MGLTVQEVDGQRIVEGAPGQPLMRSVADVALALEACLSDATHLLLLYPENLTERFFDLSSGEAGEILQKLRNYRIRLAVVRTPALRLSSRFGELLADEAGGPHFGLFDDHVAAEGWLLAAR